MGLIHDLPTVIVATAAPGQVDFDFPFKIYAVTDLEVMIDGVLSNYDPVPSGTEYSVAPDPEEGGTISFGAGLVGGEEVLINSITPLERVTQFPETGPVPMSDVNMELNRHVRLMQDIKRAGEESIKVFPGEDGIVLPPAGDRALKYLFFDAGGNPIYSPGSGDTGLAAALALASGASIVGFSQPGADLRTVEDELRDTIKAYQYGAVGDGVTDDTEALRAAFAAALALGVNSVWLGAGHYKVTGQIDVPHNFTIHSHGAIIDGSQSFDVADGLNVLNVGATTLTALPDLAGDESVGDTLVTFVAPHGLVAGDVFAIYNPTDYSFSSSRAYYRKGEFAQVAEVTSTTQVRLTNGWAEGGLAASTDCYKLHVGTFAVIGELEVRATQPAPADATVGVRLNQIANSHIGRLRVTATGGAYTGIMAYRCYKIALDYVIRQDGPSVSGDAYGMMWANCQQCIGRGHATSARHGLSHGGGADPADVPNRFIHNEGSWETTAEGAVFAVDVHGNADAISFDGTTRGGIDCGGKGVRYRGLIHAESTSGIAVYFGEVKRPMMDFAGVRIIGNGLDPSAISRGLIDFGGNGTADCDNMEGGLIDFSNCVIEAPACQRVFNMRKRSTTFVAGTRHAISLRGAFININGAAATPILVNKVGAAGTWYAVDLTGLIINSVVADGVIDTDNITAALLKGSQGVTVTNAVPSATQAVVFSKPFPSGYIPSVRASTRANGANGALVSHIVHNVTATGFSITVYTIDKTNFGVGRTDTYDWTAR